MAVVGIAQERPDSPKGDFSLNKHKITREFIVQTDSYNDGVLTVTAAIGIPRIFQIYTFGTELHHFCRCRNITADRVEPNSLFWIVTAEYETPDPINEQGNYNEGGKREVSGQENNPLLEFPTLESRMEKFQQAVYGVYDSGTGLLAPCKASNGEIFDPPPTSDSSRLVCTFGRNEDLSSPHPQTGILYTDAVNSDAFFGADVGQAKVQSIQATRQTKQLADGSQFSYLRVQYTIEFRPTWDTFLLDHGTYYIDSLSGKKLRFLTDDGHPTTGTLDGAGHKATSPVFLQFRFYNRLPFAALNLPSSFAGIG